MRLNSVHAQVLNGFHCIAEENDEDSTSSDNSSVESEIEDDSSDDSGYHTNPENLNKRAYNILGRLPHMVNIRVRPRYLNTCDCKNKYRTGCKPTCSDGLYWF